MKKKQYQKPLLEKVSLKVTESILTACKTAVRTAQPGHSNKACNASPPKARCLNDVGS